MGEITSSRDKFKARLFNRIISQLCAIKGLKYMSIEEYTRFHDKVKPIIDEELDRWFLEMSKG